MLYKDAEAYAEAMVFARKAIEDGVKTARAQQQAQRAGFYNHFMEGKDPTAEMAVREVLPLPIVRCFYKGRSFLVEQPELWLKVITDSLLLFKQRFGAEAYQSINHRFMRGWSVQRLTAAEGISKRAYQTRRTAFLSGLVLLAVQNGLISVTFKVKNVV